MLRKQLQQQMDSGGMRFKSRPLYGRWMSRDLIAFMQGFTLVEALIAVAM